MNEYIPLKQITASSAIFLDARDGVPLETYPLLFGLDEVGMTWMLQLSHGDPITWHWERLPVVQESQNKKEK